MPIQINDRIALKNNLVGIVRYIGPVEGRSNDWVGIELDEPRGKNDGSYNNKRYFSCAPNHGLFVKYIKLKSTLHEFDRIKDFGSRSENITHKSIFSEKTIFPETHLKQPECRPSVGNNFLFSEELTENQRLRQENANLRDEIQKYKTMVSTLIQKSSDFFNSTRDQLEIIEKRLSKLKVGQRTESERDYVVGLVRKIFETLQEKKPVNELFEEFQKVMKSNGIPVE